MFKLKITEHYINGMTFQSFKKAIDWEKVGEVAIIIGLFLVLILATSY